MRSTGRQEFSATITLSIANGSPRFSNVTLLTVCYVLLVHHKNIKGNTNTLSDCVVRTTLPNESMRKKDRPKQGVCRYSMKERRVPCCAWTVEPSTYYPVPVSHQCGREGRETERVRQASPFPRLGKKNRTTRWLRYWNGRVGSTGRSMYRLHACSIQFQICGDQRPFIGLNRLCPLQAPARVYSPILARSGDLPAYLPTYRYYQ